MNGTLEVHHFALLAQLRGNHRLRLRPDVFRSSSHNCGRSGCDVVRGRETETSSPLTGYNRGSIDSFAGFVPASASTHLLRFCDTFYSWRGRFGTRPVHEKIIIFLFLKRDFLCAKLT